MTDSGLILVRIYEELWKIYGREKSSSILKRPLFKVFFRDKWKMEEIFKFDFQMEDILHILSIVKGRDTFKQSTVEIQVR